MTTNNNAYKSSILVYDDKYRYIVRVQDNNINNYSKDLYEISYLFWYCNKPS